MRNFFKWLGILIVVLIVLFLFFPNLFLRVPQPPSSGTVALSDLQEPVTVYFDEYGVPHIYAENEHDLFYAAGYIMASERLFQIDLANRAIQGRLAEVSPDMLDADKYLRMWGFHRLGQRIAQDMNPETRQILQWACDGLNKYIEIHQDNLPLEFKLAGHKPLRWDPAIVAGFARFMGEDLNMAWGSELAVAHLREIFGAERARDLFPPYELPTAEVSPTSPASLASLLDAISAARAKVMAALGRSRGQRASNNWVVSGEHTTTGAPLLANDMHLGYSQPPVWYEMHLVGGRFNVHGVCFPGLPLIMSGHNQHIAWGTTNLATDDTDFYEEQVHPEDSTRYLYKGEWLPFTVHQEAIQVRDGDPVILEIRETVHGVIINDFDDIADIMDQPIAMRWVGQDNSDEASAFLALNLSRNWQDFSRAAAQFAVPGQNMIYADREGNIGWRPFVRIPLHPAAETLTVFPGAGGEYDWRGYVPFEDMPFLFNPPEGYIATANHRTIDESFPHYVSSYWSPGYRYRRITELLNVTDKHSIESLMAIQNDVVSVQARELLPHLLAAYMDPDYLREQSPQVIEALDLMRQWDHAMDSESAAATIFVVWTEHLREAIYKDEMEQAGDDYYAYFLRTGFSFRSVSHILNKGQSTWFDNVTTPGVEDRDTIIRRAFEDAVAQLTDEMSGKVSKWTWGRLHTLTHVHPLAGGSFIGKFLNWWLGLNVGPFRLSGTGNVINAINYSAEDPFLGRKGAYKSTWGPSERSIVDLSDPDNTRYVLPTGQSGHPFSRHYSDQAELYNRGEYRTVPFTREAVEEAAYSTLVLHP